MTNFEKIKAMTVEEMAEFIEDCGSCSRCMRRGNDCFPAHDVEQWLQKEAN